jgi:hypothetical protein
MSCEGQVNVFQSDRVFLVRRQGRNVWRVTKSTQEYLKTLIQIGCSFQFLISHSKKISFFTSSSSRLLANKRRKLYAGNNGTWTGEKY